MTHANPDMSHDPSQALQAARDHFGEAISDEPKSDLDGNFDDDEDWEDFEDEFDDDDDEMKTGVTTSLRTMGMRTTSASR
jgi:hypothetical protein